MLPYSQTDTHTVRKVDIKSDRHTVSQTYVRSERHTVKQTYIPTDRQPGDSHETGRDRQTSSHINKQMKHRSTKEQVDRQTLRWTDKVDMQLNIQKEKQNKMVLL